MKIDNVVLIGVFRLFETIKKTWMYMIYAKSWFLIEDSDII